MKRGAEEEFGIENTDFAPECDAGKRHRLRNAEIAPGRPPGEAFWLRNG